MVELLGGSPLSRAVMFDSDNLRMGSQALEDTRKTRMNSFVNNIYVHLTPLVSLRFKRLVGENANSP